MYVVKAFNFYSLGVFSRPDSWLNSLNILKLQCYTLNIVIQHINNSGKYEVN